MSALRPGLPIAIYYRVTWQVLILVTASLAVASEVVRPLVGIPFFLISFFLVTSYGGNIGSRRRTLVYGIGFALFLLAINQINRFSGFPDLVEVMIEMICGSLPLMLLNHDRPRSYWLSVLNVAVIAVGSISFSSNVLSYAGFLLFVAILLFNLNAADLHLPDAAGRRFDEELPRGYFWQFLQAMPIGLVAAVVIFYAFPRAQSFSLSLGKLMGQAKSGYSGLVSLSGDGAIETSTALAFNVDAPDKGWLRKDGPRLLFRGDALDTFDGQSWTASVFDYRLRDQVKDLRIAKRYAQEFQMMTIDMEPTPHSTIFYPEVLLDVLGKSRNTGNMMVNTNGSIVRDVFNLERFSYTIRTARRLPLKEVGLVRLRELAQDMPPFSAVPPEVLAAPWFKAWVAEVGLDPKTQTLADASEQITAHFRDGFEASLANEFSSKDALEAFLTKDRKGHCEYFATATTLLLRAQGIPARVVVGYRGGTYNHLIDVLEVREENAHAWVEAFVPEVGWLALDPTPAAPFSPTSLSSNVRLYVNALAFWFRKYVVDYDQRTQREILRSIRSLAVRDDNEKIEWKDTLQRFFPPVLLGAGALALLMVVTRIYRRRAGADGLPRYYSVFLRRLRRLGLERRGGETLQVFHARLLAAGIEPRLIEAVSAGIERDLYSPAPVSATEQQSLEALVAATPVRRSAVAT